MNDSTATSLLDWLEKQAALAEELEGMNRSSAAPERHAFIHGYISAYEGRLCNSVFFQRNHYFHSDEECERAWSSFLEGYRECTADGIASGNSLCDSYNLLFKDETRYSARWRPLCQAFIEGTVAGYERLMGQGPIGAKHVEGFIRVIHEHKNRAHAVMRTLPHDVIWPDPLPAYFAKALETSHTLGSPQKENCLIGLMIGLPVASQYQDLFTEQDYIALIDAAGDFSFEMRFHRLGFLNVLHEHCDSESLRNQIYQAAEKIAEKCLTKGPYRGYIHFTPAGDYRRIPVSPVLRRVEEKFAFAAAEVHRHGCGERIFLTFSNNADWRIVPMTAGDLPLGIPYDLIAGDEPLPEDYYPPASTIDIPAEEKGTAQESQALEVLAAFNAQERQNRDSQLAQLRKSLRALEECKGELMAQDLPQRDFV